MCCVSLSLRPTTSLLLPWHINLVPAHSSSSQSPLFLSLSLILTYFIVSNTQSLRNTCLLFNLRSIILFSSSASMRMQNSSSLKQEFFKNWVTGLRKCASFKRNMSFLERKKAIKLSADLAMASTRNETTRWSRFLIVNASRDHENKALTDHIIGSPQCQQMVRKFFTSSQLCNSRNIRSRKILKRSRMVRRVKKMVAPAKVTAGSVAKRLVQKRTRILKSLLPGGEFMDDVCLIEETLDYIQSLRAQVEVMRCLVSASELINQP